jgi:ribosomal-protein-serine acetyltransferase
MFRFALSDDTHLRPLETSDADELQALIEANRDRLSAWMPWAAEQGIEQTREFIRGTRRRLADDDGFEAAILCAGRIVGVLGFAGIDRQNRSTTIGYWLDEAHEGRGVMTRAVRALVEHAFTAWKLHRVEIDVAPENRRSRAIPERLGFSEEGKLRAAQRVGDRYRDSVVYAMLAADWGR